MSTLRRFLLILTGFAAGALVGWILGLLVGEATHRDCVEMECLEIYLFAFGGALLGAAVGSAIAWAISRRRALAATGERSP